MPRIALLQMKSGIDPHANCAVISESAREAAAGGAHVLFTPEMSTLLDANRARAGVAMAEDAYRTIPMQLSKVAQDAGIDIALGSMPIPLDHRKAANRSFYLSADGSAPVTYDKMHMFDVDLSTGESWRESSAYQAGSQIVTAPDTPIGLLGFAICYDLRFPALFDALGRKRCDAIAVPAAFTRPTGEAHWHVLLRARAIEASAFVIAAAQVGKHADGRETYGHSLVVDPWGEVLLDMGGEAVGLGWCDIDLERIGEVRAQVPGLANAREMPKCQAK